MYIKAVARFVLDTDAVSTQDDGITAFRICFRSNLNQVKLFHDRRRIQDEAGLCSNNDGGALTADKLRSMINLINGG